MFCNVLGLCCPIWSFLELALRPLLIAFTLHSGKRASDHDMALMTDPLPLRLHRAASILSLTGDPGADDAQAACAETAARLVILEEALLALLSGKKGAMEQARRVLAIK